jgi:hypothetical protein
LNLLEKKLEKNIKMSDQPLPKNYDFYTVTITSIVMFSLSCFGSIIVMIRTFKQWKQIKTDVCISVDNKKLLMNYKLPFYTSCLGKNHKNN